MLNHRFIKHACLAGLLSVTAFTLAQESELPSLGDSSSAIVSPEEEYKLGHGWLRQLRAHVRTIDDPVVSNYLDNLIYKLIINSQVQDRRFDLIVIDNDKLNAFAAPGGIIGVHSGLFTYANTEDEFASVLAHELAHLSQRHFARSIEEAKRRQLPTIVGVLSSIALIAAGQGQAGMVALSGVRAANQQTALSFSRLHEQEADRVGMQTLANSGYAPGAMPDMFAHMQALYGRTNNVPEFLQTHPVTQSRIADTRNRAEQYPKRQWPPHPEYKLIQARIKVLTNGDYLRMIDSFKAGLRVAKTDEEKAGLQYGLACALLKAKRFADAQEALAPLLTSNPYAIPYLYTKADIYTTIGNPKAAIELLTPLLRADTNDGALTRAYIDALIKDKQYKQAEQMIQRLISSNEDDVWLWRRLVDVRQLSKQLPEWHIAKAQLLYLYAYYDQALQELKFALKSSEGNYVLTSIIREKEKQVLEAKAFEEDNY
jgi:predicted Zn-dependent protease